MKITKSDIAEYADFTVNISDQKVNFQIKDAGNMDVAPVIGKERYQQLLALPEGDQSNLSRLYLALVPFWAMCAYKRIIAFHGVDVAQAGLVVPTGTGFEPASDKRRGEILGAIRSKVTYYQNELEAYMKSNGFVEVEDTCCAAPRKRGQFNFAVAKRSQPRCRPDIRPPYQYPEVPEIPEEPEFTYRSPWALPLTFG